MPKRWAGSRKRLTRTPIVNRMMPMLLTNLKSPALSIKHTTRRSEDIREALPFDPFYQTQNLTHINRPMKPEKQAEHLLLFVSTAEDAVINVDIINGLSGYEFSRLRLTGSLG